VNQGDWEAVAGLLGRAPQGTFEVVVRDRAGGPVVILNFPLLADGTPMPTRYWLVGRTEREAVSRLESTGGGRAAEDAVDAADLEAAHASYRHCATRRCHRTTPAEADGGVGGTRRGVKCLHAHLAWYLAAVLTRSGVGPATSSASTRRGTSSSPRGTTPRFSAALGAR